MGSLFKTREVWSVKLDDDEGFHCNSLLVDNVDNEPNGSDKIVVGSLKGILRIYLVRTNEYTASDLLIETDLGLPILQVSTGRLLPASNNLNLVVLHPRKFSVYSISGTAGLSDQGSNYNILLMYEHILQRSAFNMVLGTFGHVKGKDFICVQALDGTLSFFEQESFSFSRFLPNYLLPGPFGYDPINDSFIIATVSRTIESYRYQVLAIAKDDEEAATSSLITGKGQSSNSKNSGHRGRRVVPDWSCLIGETALDLNILRVEKNILYIVVLGEHNLFLMSESGELNFARKFDFNPLCMCSYLYPTNELMLLIASEYNSLLVFSRNRIKWIAQMSSRAICILRGQINNTPGVLISLSDTGDLTCFYLGTNPSFSFANINPSFQQINYETCEKELKSLKKVIKNFTESNSSSNSSGKGAKNVHDSDLTVSIVQIETNEDKFTETTSVTLKITLATGENKLFNIRVTLSPSPPLAVNKSVTSIAQLDSNSKMDLIIIISLSKSPKFLPSNLKLITNVLYHLNSPNSAPRISQTNYFLPFRLIGQPVNTINLDFSHQMSIDIINSPQVSLKDLLPSIEASNEFEVIIQISTVKIDSFVAVSIAAKKFQQKITIKSNSYQSLMFITLHLLQICKTIGCKFDSASFDKSSLKLNQFFILIDSYEKLSSKIIETEENLDVQSGYFKSIIKRILIKMKDRNPAPLNKLDLMLERLNQKLFSLTEEAIELEGQICALNNNLNTAGSVIAQLLALATGMKTEQANLIRFIFSGNDSHSLKRDWGKRMELAIRDLFSSKPNSSAKVDLTDVTDSHFSSSKLKSLIESLVDSAYKGDLFERSKVQASASSEISASPPPPGPVLKSNFVGPTNTVIPEEDEDEGQFRQG